MSRALVVCHWRGLTAANVDSALMEYAVGSWGASLAWINDDQVRVLGAQFASVDELAALHPDHEIVALVPGDDCETLREFVHPERAIYVIGADDVGFVVPDGARRLAIESATGPAHPLYSWQVATVVLYDRFVKDD